MKFDLFIEEIQKNQWEIFDVEVFENGKILHEWHRDGIERHMVYSATKTITSLAAGMAFDEGKLDLDASLYEYFQAELQQIWKSAVSEEGQKQRDMLFSIEAIASHEKLVTDLKAITVERLLTMSVDGYPFRPSGEHWLENVLKISLPNARERVFSYSNVSAYLVGVIVEKAVGEPLYEYLTRKLFSKLGIEKPEYQTCPDGHFYGATGMALNVRELRKIGQLLLEDGKFEGEQIVSEEYVRWATSLQQENDAEGYGYFVWMHKDGFSINGKWGQRCIVLPKEQKIVTILSHMEHGFGKVIEAMEQYL